jgi:hypothetical protein
MLMILAACGSDDDYVYPDLVTSFAEVHTDNEGVCASLTTDDGLTRTIHAREGLSGLTPDSTYRMVTGYVALSQDEVELYTAQKTISPIPKLAKEFNEFHTDPVELTSIWRSGNYLNLVIKAMVKDQSHALHFIDMGIRQEDFHRCLDLMLYHDRNQDVEAFSRTVYLSVPLQGYATSLQTGDSIRFTLTTYAEGVTSRTLAW